MKITDKGIEIYWYDLSIMTQSIIVDVYQSQNLNLDMDKPIGLIPIDEFNKEAEKINNENRSKEIEERMKRYYERYTK